MSAASREGFAVGPNPCDIEIAADESFVCAFEIEPTYATSALIRVEFDGAFCRFQCRPASSQRGLQFGQA